MAWYMRTAEDTNSTDVYLPKTTLEKAGCLGVGSAVPTDPNLVFASIITPGNEREPYPTGLPGGGAYITTPVAVETTSTLVVDKLGPDMIVNGGFDTDTVWTKGAGCTIAGGLGVFTAAANTTVFSQPQVFVVGATYLVMWTLSGFVLGGVRPVFGGGTLVVAPIVSANGTYQHYLTAVTGNNLFTMRTSGTTTTLNIDNISMQQVY